MYATDTTDITLNVNPYYMCHDSRGHHIKYEVLWYKKWPRVKFWLVDNSHNHVMFVKPQTLNLTKLFAKNGDNLITLWETAIVSNENVQKPTKMFGESNNVSLWPTNNGNC